jgi:hypothetical protein
MIYYNQISPSVYFKTACRFTAISLTPVAVTGVLSVFAPAGLALLASS